ncbi:MAG: hypothetical protein ACOY37_00935 [Pseudomonadota bacterium]
MKFDLFRRHDGALVVVPSHFADASPAPDAASLRFVRRVRMELGLLGDELVRDIGLHGYAVACGADEALLRNGPTDEVDAPG